ncbi:hypothetical protein C8035_v006645 [Colletotrichum spinosum]|uniref:Uncharacterized protein n=1 Tax=Colletotrichum spinosum TaxID=1347390 RepID=A0A4R8PPD0_9PEZI|nr:hypothetical protein C8035_v006645 [Colletotrichum spinosum]
MTAPDWGNAHARFTWLQISPFGVIYLSVESTIPTSLTVTVTRGTFTQTDFVAPGGALSIHLEGQRWQDWVSQLARVDVVFRQGPDTHFPEAVKKPSGLRPPTGYKKPSPQKPKTKKPGRRQADPEIDDEPVSVPERPPKRLEKRPKGCISGKCLSYWDEA